MYLFYTMKYSAYLLFVAVTSLMGSASAQQENWDTYMARYGSKPGSVMVDLAQMSSAPDKLLPYLVVTGPKAKNCTNPQGIPDTSEIFEMEKILDVTGGILSGATAKKLVGTFTYNCERVNYYYVKDTTAVRTALSRMYSNHFREYEYTLKIKHEPLWLTYRTFLYPDSTAAAWMVNNKIILGMLQSGDNLEEPRNINYTFGFSTDTARTTFGSYATANRYNITATENAQSTLLPHQITVSRRGTIVMDSVMAMESELIRTAKTMKGYYKGWDAPKK